MAAQGFKLSSPVYAIAAMAPIALLTIFLSSSFGQTSGAPSTKAALPLGVEQPALATVINGPTEMAYSRGKIYLIETAGMETWSLDTVRQTATLILGAPTDPYTHDKNVLGSPFAIAVTNNGNIFVGDVGGKLAKVNVDTHSALVKRPALLEEFPQIHAMAADPRNGTVVLTDRHALLRWIPETNELTRLGGFYDFPGFSGDGGH